MIDKDMKKISRLHDIDLVQVMPISPRMLVRLSVFETYWNISLD